MSVTEKHIAWLEGRSERLFDREAADTLLVNLATNLKSYMDGVTNSSIEKQVFCLGLTASDINSLKGERVLDVCCGSEGNLVYWMRELGIEAEGIDPLVGKNKPFIMRQIVGGSPEHRIPRENCNYRLVLAHFASPLNRGLSRMPAYFNTPVDTMVSSVGILMECLRVMNSDGRFIVHPALGRSDFLNPILTAEGYEMSQKMLLDDSLSGLEELKDSSSYTEIRRKSR